MRGALLCFRQRRISDFNLLACGRLLSCTSPPLSPPPLPRDIRSNGTPLGLTGHLALYGHTVDNSTLGAIVLLAYRVALRAVALPTSYLASDQHPGRMGSFWRGRPIECSAPRAGKCPFLSKRCRTFQPLSFTVLSCADGKLRGVQIQDRGSEELWTERT